MNFPALIQVFPEALKKQPQKFDIQDLQDLDAILAGLETAPEETIKKLEEEWFGEHDKLTDTLILFAERKREIGKLPPKPPISEAEILENLFELRKTNRKTLADKTNPPPTASKDAQQPCDTLADKTNPPPTASKDAQHP
jgi:hypothetical protein